jgi:hypothetical protein
MDTKSIAALIIKITGLILIVVVVAELPTYVPFTSRGYDFSIGETLGAVALGLGPLALAGLLLWFFPGTITNRIVSGPGPAVDFRPLELVAITVLGIWLLADGIIGAVRDAVTLIVMSRYPSSQPIPASIVGHIGATLAELVIGAALCIGARGISNVVGRLRR